MSTPGPFDPAVCFGTVVHSRLRPRAHAFRHPVFFLQIPLAQLDRLSIWPLSVDRPNLLSVQSRDHGARDGSALEPWARALLDRHGLGHADGPIVLQTFPRVFGYAFNPVSFWYCHDRSGALIAVLAEVNNTFAERHNYLVAHEDGRPIGDQDWIEARKVFHVSPFCEVAGRYRFRFVRGGERTLARIDYDDGDGPLLATSIEGTRTALGRTTLLRALLRQPVLGLGVVARIHLHALRLWLKGVPFHRKPVPPLEQTTR